MARENDKAKETHQYHLNKEDEYCILEGILNIFWIQFLLLNRLVA